MSDTSTTRSGRDGGRPVAWSDRSRWHDPVTRFNAAFWGLAILAGTSDVLLTYYGLQFGLIELNPVVRWSVVVFGSGALPVLKVGALLLALVGWLAVERVYKPLIPLILGVPWCAAAIVNVSLFLSHL